MRVNRHKRLASAVLAGLLALVAPATLLAAPAGAMAAGAAPQAGASGAAIEARINDAVQDLLLRLVDSGEVAPEQLAALTVTAAPSRRAEFGAIIDLGHDPAPGVPVLAVTPGGNAAQLGLRAGDRILAVDGEALAHAEGGAAAHALQQRLDAGVERLRLTVARDGSNHELAGPLRSHVLPGYRLELGSALAAASVAAAADSRDCGRVSVFDTAPRAQHIYPAVLIAVDGRLPGPTSGPSWRVPAGRHVLTVAERIDSEQFGDLQRFQRDRRSDGGYKELEIVVEPNTTYRIGARFILDRRSSIRDNGYWEPVVYAELGEPCS